ncbi:MAG: CHAT domain-containing tetratricopeptide repeat protein [Gemmatimonadaceae bacterium]
MRRLVVMIFVVVLGIIAVPAAAQDSRAEADSARLLDSLATALRIWDRPTPESRKRAVEFWSGAAALYRRAGDRRRESDALTQAGRGHGDGDTASAYLRSALQIARAEGDTVGMGRALLWLGVRSIGMEPDSALRLRREAVRIARQVGKRWGEGRAWAFYWVAHGNVQLGQRDTAWVYYREAVAVARETGDRTPESGAVGDLGNMHAHVGRIDSAFVYYAAALAGFRAVGHRPFEASWLNNIGLVHQALGRLDSARFYYQQGLVVARESHHRLLELFLTINTGLAFMGSSRADSAETYYRQALVLARAIGESDGEAVTLGNLGEAQLTLGQPDSALANLRTSITMLRASGGAQLAQMLSALGKVHVAAGRGDSAFAAYRDGLAVARRVEDRGAEIDLLRSVADLHASSGTSSLASAVAYYDSAAALQEATSAHAGTDQGRVSFAETAADLFNRWTLAWLGRGEEVGREQSVLAALAVAERGRAQALLDLLRRNQRRRESAMDTVTAGQPLQTAGGDLIGEGRDLATSVQAMGVPAIVYMATKDTLLTWLIMPTGEVTVERQAVARDSVAQIVAAVRGYLGADEAMGRSLRSIESSDVLENSPRPPVPAVTRSALRSPMAMFDASAAALIPASLTARLPARGEVVIVPHGPLALVAFAALPISSGGGRNLNGETLGARYAIRYSPSLTTLRFVSAPVTAGEPGSTNARAAVRQAALVVGNPTMPLVAVARGGKVRLPALPAAGREGRWVAEALGVAPLTGGAATERAVRERMAAAGVIHLATHGFAYSADAKALDSFVAFAPDSTADGLLTVGEVIEEIPRLTAELVVLSACQTGLGNLRQSEGTVGLQRAFLAKGARSVLVSLWSVSDEATELLMRRFYTHWLRDRDQPDKAEALRRAQGDVRGTPGYADPRYWAAFQLVGAR